MIVAVVGSREYPNLGDVAAFIAKLAKKHPGSIVVSGGARGVDREAEKAARTHGLNIISYRPYEYENMEHRREFSIETVTHGDRAQALVVAKSRRISPPFFRSYASAAFHRNGWIVDDAEVVTAFWDGISTGTDDTIRKAVRAEMPHFVYRPALGLVSPDSATAPQSHPSSPVLHVESRVAGLRRGST